VSAPRAPGPIARAIRFIRMAGTSIAAPDAALWVTDFLNAAYYARPREDRDVDPRALGLAPDEGVVVRLGRPQPASVESGMDPRAPGAPPR
jgi:hypothetical protein